MQWAGRRMTICRQVGQSIMQITFENLFSLSKKSCQVSSKGQPQIKKSNFLINETLRKKILLSQAASTFPPFKIILKQN